jgi:hypothetical protein
LFSNLQQILSIEEQKAWKFPGSKYSNKGGKINGAEKLGFHTLPAITREKSHNGLVIVGKLRRTLLLSKEFFPTLN